VDEGFYPGTGRRPVSGEKHADEGICGISAAMPTSLLTGHRPPAVQSSSIYDLQSAIYQLID
jgi:hypothetical protein